ncbi:MAG: hypothetical protein U1E35_01510 [Rhodospirillales bacterium]
MDGTAGAAAALAYGMTKVDIPAVLEDSRGSSMKTNPVVLTDAEIEELIRSRL